MPVSTKEAGANSSSGLPICSKEQVGMTTHADDELWSAIANASRRRVLDLLVSNGDVSASWLAGKVPFSARRCPNIWWSWRPPA